MPENWETSIFPIIKEYLENNIDEKTLSDDGVVLLSNTICRRIDKLYIIEKRRINKYG